MKHLIVIVALLMTASTALAQQTAHIGYVYPAGGRVGTTFEVAIGGQRLVGVSQAHVNGDGVEAKVIEHIMPLSPVQALILRDELKALMEHQSVAATRPATTRPWTDAEEKKLASIRAKLASYQPRPASPAIAEMVKLQVTIAPTAEPGTREIRLLTSNGLTNPMVFEVGRLEEFSKPPATWKTSASQEMSVTLPGVINGQIMPGQVDQFRFAARKGDHLVAITAARKLVPYLADAVPGWFQATLTVYDANGKELAYADDYRFQPDPILHYAIPADGDYVIAIRDSIYRGREDFVYRIALGELPFVTSVFPLGGKAGERTAVKLKGWNLASSRVVMDATTLEAGVYPLAVSKRAGICNSPAFAIDTLPECVERENNDARASAQEVTMPIIVNGRIDRPGDCDVFSFEAAAGETVVAEVTARRLDSPLDSVLTLTDSGGQRVALNDDQEDKGSGLSTHHADSRIRVTVSDAGRYFVHLGDVQRNGSGEHGYRLRISHPRHDFALRVLPASINVPPGGSTSFTVFALRRDGYTGEINLALNNAPPGFRISPSKIPATQESVKLSLTAPSRRMQGPLALHVQGTAAIDGNRTTRAAIAADDMMQAFIYRHLVCADELLIANPARRPPR